MRISGESQLCNITSREKVRELTHLYDKSPYTIRKPQKSKGQHENVTKIFDYTKIADI